MQENYIRDDAYTELIDRIEAIAKEHDAADLDLRFLIQEALGDHVGVWPNACRPIRRASVESTYESFMQKFAQLQTSLKLPVENHVLV